MKCPIFHLLHANKWDYSIFMGVGRRHKTPRLEIKGYYSQLKQLTAWLHQFPVSLSPPGQYMGAKMESCSGWHFRRVTREPYWSFKAALWWERPSHPSRRLTENSFGKWPKQREDTFLHLCLALRDEEEYKGPMEECLPTLSSMISWHQYWQLPSSLFVSFFSQELKIICILQNITISIIQKLLYEFVTFPLSTLS